MSQREEVQPGCPQKTESTAWIYQGRSSHAFQEDTSYLGPFNGHVNGALVMKELEKPWYHWESAQEPNFDQCFSDAEKASFMSTPYISSDGNLFSGVSDANKIQITIQNGVTRWYTQRSKNHFPEPLGGAASSTRVIQRWMSHVLLTITVNITVAAVNTNLPGMAWFAPADHFINNMMLKLSSFSDLLPEYPKLAFTGDNYQKAVDELGLYLIQENMTNQAIPGYENLTAKAGTLGGGKEAGEHEQLSFVAVKRGEGLPFVALQPSYEDAQGAQKMQSISSTVSLLSEATFNALMMVDICNPIYS
ncbi:uncharacterized protein LAJ45_08641 [Morchella importuna]|uniref:uncharacterized protein n=1 Tax=Morchella importuna TaxID=1174673 RepID=UPI001E8E8030|nr:uncharacterized protein LAJ45_08641 [Morchella importuna]KAH8147163.1 hypothetical protein LAJ45_08641 [Morchella importuna]